MPSIPYPVGVIAEEVPEQMGNGSSAGVSQNSRTGTSEHIADVGRPIGGGERPRRLGRSSARTNPLSTEGLYTVKRRCDGGEMAPQKVAKLPNFDGLFDCER
jgi:hypothetical protein